MLTVSTGVEVRLIEHRKAKQWHEAYRLIESQMASATGIELGWLRLELGITQIYASMANARRALANIEAALPLLVDAPEIMARAICTGMMCARCIEDTHRLKAYASEAKTLLADTRAHAWRGRLLIWRGYYHQDSGKLELAAQYFTWAVQFHQENLGPFGEERDRLCHLRLAHAALADVQWIAGQKVEAAASLRRALEVPGDAGQTATLYLMGRMAHMDQRHADAIPHLTAAMHRAMTERDHVTVVRAAEALAECLGGIGEWERVREVLKPIIVEAAHAPMVGVVARLQAIIRRGRE